MTDTAVVTELVIDPDPAARSADAFAAAMDKAAKAANDNLKSIADNTAALRTSMDGLARTSEATSESTKAWGIELAEVVNHLKHAGEAAYLLSPTFRGAVNEVASQAKSVAVPALEAVAGAMIVGVNKTGQALVALGGGIAEVSPQLAGFGTGVAAVGARLAAFSPSVAAAAAGVLAFLAPVLAILGPLLLLYKAVTMLIEAWQLSGEAMQKHIDIANKAAALNVSTDFYQRIEKGAEAAKLPIDALTASLQKLQTATANQLGGSAGMNRLDELTKAGNFTGNSGVGALQQANSVEEKFRAVVSLIDQAMTKGERLAALDVAKTFLGDQVAQNLANDADYLNKMQASADKVAATDLIPAEQIARSADLQRRLDEAEKILSQRWHPIQDLLTEGGFKLREMWVGTVEAVAAAFSWIAQIVDKISAMPGWAISVVTRGAKYDDDTLRANGLEPISQAERDMANARKRLATGLMTPGALDQAAMQANSVQYGVRKDASKDPAEKSAQKAAEEAAGAYDRATESLLKYIATTEAAAQTVGRTAAEIERAKAMAQLLAAAEKDGTTVTAAMRAEMEGLADRAAKAADALARARIAADIKFNRDTAFLSQEDVAIAQQLRTIYPDVATALGSVEAQGIRVNNAMRTLSGSLESELTNGLTDIVSGSKSASQGFTDMANSFAKMVEQMIIKIMIVEPMLRGLRGVASDLLGVGGGAGTGLSLTGTGGLYANGGVFELGNVVPFATGGLIDRPTVFPMANGGVGLAGEAGTEAIMPLRRDPQGRLGVSAQGGGGSVTSVSFGDIHIAVPEGTSANDAQAIGRAVREQMAQVIDERLIYHSRSRGVLNRGA